MKLPKQTVNRDRGNETAPQSTGGVAPQSLCQIGCNLAHGACIAAGIPPAVCNAGLAACLSAC
ncbi:hypothetical protein Pan44_21400 [Caulifigura coniformis]|uniref:Uncharacterized protein n=1 Tax=Caulifigura coniformis TaxID=2527983 RepID=A0A517SDA5_9PLAN|nr:hypothetical protein [Caulifigura coniformis]QDT54113.1 hypothetical protein Pan44_21400 [Caulifigura coniformis]